MQTPSIFQSLLNAETPETQFSVPFGGAFRHAIKGEISGSARISGLLELVRPLAVIRRVVAVVVDSIKGVSIARPWSHIGEEVYKTDPIWKHPSFAHFDPAAAVSCVRPSGLICAARDNSGVGRVLSGSSARVISPALPMNEIGRHLPLAQKASAGSGVAACEMNGLRHGFLSAVAKAAKKKLRSLLVFPAFLNAKNDKSPVATPDVLNFLRHNGNESVSVAFASTLN